MVQMFTAGEDALHAFSFPPAADWARNHPYYYLLGFSAALAPKFPPWVLRGMGFGFRVYDLCETSVRPLHKWCAFSLPLPWRLCGPRGQSWE